MAGQVRDLAWSPSLLARLRILIGDLRTASRRSRLHAQRALAACRKPFHPLTARRGYANSLNGLKTLSPGRLKSRSFPVAIVRPCRRAVAAI